MAISSAAGTPLSLSRHGTRKVVTDATGMRSVFYSADGSIVGSHAKLVSDQIAEPSIQSTPFRGGHPGRQTPYANVFLLTPNTTVEMGAARVRRFFPREGPRPGSAEEVADFIYPLARNALLAAQQQNPLLFSLTAGMDTRTTLAVASDIVRGSLSFTYANDPSAERTRLLRVVDADCALSIEIAQYIGATHRIIYPQPASATIVKAARENAYMSHGIRLIEPFMLAFGQDRYLHVRSNLLEIGRAYYSHLKQDLTSSIGAAAIFLRRGNKQHIEKSSLVKMAFSDLYLVTAAEEAHEKGYHPIDIYYWEFRMSALARNVHPEHGLRI